MKSRPGPPPRRRAARAPRAAERAPTYQDLVQIVELVRSASQFSEFRLRSGGIEIEMRRANGEDRGAAPVETVPQAKIEVGNRKEESPPAGLVLVRAPMVGTFYRSPEPGAPPFVAPGARVEAGSTVGIIEVMKLMSSIAAGCAGVVRRVLVEDAEPVEYGQALVAIEPDA